MLIQQNILLIPICKSEQLIYAVKNRINLMNNTMMIRTDNYLIGIIIIKAF